MLLEQFEVKGLAHYSYVVGCERSGRAVVVDPKRDVDTYLDFVARRGLSIAFVLETHIHADYASGARELAARSGAPLCVSRYDHGETFEVAHPHRDLADGDLLDLGDVRLRVLHTPGHTPEHVAYLIYDRTRDADAPAALLSGDFLFAGSVGRPDLLGEEARARLTSELFDSLRERIAGLPDGLPVYAAHGAGSMCGAGLAPQSSTTLGAERRSNPYLDPSLTRETFAHLVLSTLPPFPPYYRRMKRVNAAGAPPLSELPPCRPLDAPEFKRRIDAGAVVVDLRHSLDFGAGHVPGAFGIQFGPTFAPWAAWVVPYDVPILLVADGTDPCAIEAARGELVRVGLDQVVGWLAGGVGAWAAAGLPLSRTPQLPPEELHRRLRAGEKLHVLDVRGDSEFASGHVPGARHIMFGQLPDRIADVPADGRPVAVMCGGGLRSTIGASVLERAGISNVFNVPGGMGAWRRAGLPIEAS